MIHSFDTIVAKKVGINSAVILNNLYYWIEKNKANEKNYYDGYYWTYNSKKAFGELFPYFTTRQIDYAIKKLIDDGYVITGNYNKIAYDRTLWYAITEKGYELLTGNTSNNSVNPISQNCKMDETKLLNGNHEIVKPIPDSKPDNKPDSNKKVSKKEKAPEKKSISFDEIIDSYTENEELRMELKEHLKTRKSKKATMTNRAIELSLNKLDKLSDSDEEKIQIVQNAIMSGWTTFYPLKNNDNKPTNSYQEQRVTINGKEYIMKNGKYYVPRGSGIPVNPYAVDDLPF